MNKQQIAVMAGVMVLVVGVLWLKNHPAASEGTGAEALPTVVTPTNKEASATLPAITLAPTEASASVDEAMPMEVNPLVPRADESPEAHLDRLLDEGQPIFAFFHSNTCHQCTQMAAIVAEVYPEFETAVALVDVDVYDTANQSLLSRAEIRVIPTLIFINPAGEGQGYTGVMPAEQLQETLTTLAARGTP